MKIRNRKKEGGFAQSLELLLIATSVVGLVAVTSASLGSQLSQEYADLGAAVGSLDQSYSLGGMAVAHPGDPATAGTLAVWAGSRHVDDAHVPGFPIPTSGLVLCALPNQESAASLAGALP